MISERHRERDGAEADPCGVETVTDHKREDQSLHCRGSSGNELKHRQKVYQEEKLRK